MREGHVKHSEFRPYRYRHGKYHLPGHAHLSGSDREAVKGRIPMQTWCLRLNALDFLPHAPPGSHSNSNSSVSSDGACAPARGSIHSLFDDEQPPAPPAPYRQIRGRPELDIGLPTWPTGQAGTRRTGRSVRTQHHDGPRHLKESHERPYARRCHRPRRG